MALVTFVKFLWFEFSFIIFVIRFDFAAMPIVHPRFKREFLEGKAKDRKGAFARSDLFLSSQGEFTLNKEQLTRVGLEPNTSGLMCQCSTN